MKAKKPPLEADLDPRGARRPGSKAAESAVKNAAGVPARTRKSGSPRPGAKAAERAVAASKRKGRSGGA